MPPGFNDPPDLNAIPSGMGDMEDARGAAPTLGGGVSGMEREHRGFGKTLRDNAKAVADLTRTLKSQGVTGLREYRRELEATLRVAQQLQGVQGPRISGVPAAGTTTQGLSSTTTNIGGDWQMAHPFDRGGAGSTSKMHGGEIPSTANFAPSGFTTTADLRQTTNGGNISFNGAGVAPPTPTTPWSPVMRGEAPTPPGMRALKGLGYAVGGAAAAGASYLARHEGGLRSRDLLMSQFAQATGTPGGRYGPQRWDIQKQLRDTGYATGALSSEDALTGASMLRTSSGSINALDPRYRAAQTASSSLATLTPGLGREGAAGAYAELGTPQTVQRLRMLGIRQRPAGIMQDPMQTFSQFSKRVWGSAAPTMEQVSAMSTQGTAANRSVTQFLGEGQLSQSYLDWARASAVNKAPVRNLGDMRRAGVDTNLVSSLSERAMAEENGAASRGQSEAMGLRGSDVLATNTSEGLDKAFRALGPFSGALVTATTFLGDFARTLGGAAGGLGGKAIDAAQTYALIHGRKAGAAGAAGRAGAARAAGAVGAGAAGAGAIGTGAALAAGAYGAYDVGRGAVSSFSGAATGQDPTQAASAARANSLLASDFGVSGSAAAVGWLWNKIRGKEGDKGDAGAGMDPRMRRGLSAMFRDNPNLQLNSGKRSHAQQHDLGNGVDPQASKHVRGTASDIGPSSEYGWLAANAHKYGLEKPDPNEPWHFEVQGTRSDHSKHALREAAGGVGGSAYAVGTSAPLPESLKAQSTVAGMTAYGEMLSGAFVTNSYRSGSTTYHGKGQATDWQKRGGSNSKGYNEPGLRSIFDHFAGVAGKMKEVFLSGAPYWIKNGQKVYLKDLKKWSSYARLWDTHWNHVHAATTEKDLGAGGGAAGGTGTAGDGGTGISVTGAGGQWGSTDVAEFISGRVGTPGSTQSVSVGVGAGERSGNEAAGTGTATSGGGGRGWASIERGAKGAGWKSGGSPDLVTMMAIAMGEGGGNPRAHNDNRATGDNSYGHWQINMIDSMGPSRRKSFGIGSNEELFDPITNAKAADKIFSWQGYGAWSVYKSGAHQKHMGAARAAANSPEMGDPTEVLDSLGIGGGRAPVSASEGSPATITSSFGASGLGVFNTGSRGGGGGKGKTEIHIQTLRMELNLANASREEVERLYDMLEMVAKSRTREDRAAGVMARA